MKSQARLCQCGEVFVAADPRRIRCRKDCGRVRRRTSDERNKGRKARAKTNRQTFVGVDGEGVDRADGSHEYVLLCVGDDALYLPRGKELGLEQIFEHLYGCYEKSPNSTYVGFFLSYDFAQWFKHLPEERARMLYTPEGKAIRRRTGSGGNYTPFPVQWKGWEFDLMADRRFKLRPEKGKWMYICDAGPFFQTSLLNVINPDTWPEDQGVCTPEEYETIIKGKQDRSSNLVRRGTNVTQEMIDYCTLENRVFSRVMTKLNEGLVTMGVKLNRKQWFGPGQAASAWLTKAAPQIEGAHIREAVPTEVLEAARDSYYGGWFELAQHGTWTDRTVWEYDINSAYPAVIATLPCLLHGKWDADPEAPYTLHKATIKGTDPHLGAMLHRNHKGNVLRPQQTTGWHWGHELQAAQKAGLIDNIDTHQLHSYQPCDCPPPLQEIADLYQQRRRLKKLAPGGAEEKALKLAYNSSYGKLAQSIGNPRWANPIYASLITTGCRTMILEAISSHPQRSADVIMIATDGIYFSSRHPSLHLGSDLGQWEETKKENFTVFKPGVHWYGEGRGLKSRGVSARGLRPHLKEVSRLWTQWEGQWPWPSVQIEIPFTVISPRLALHRNRWDLAGATLTSVPVMANSNPITKRSPSSTERHGPTVWRTSPYQTGQGPDGNEHIETTPYDQTFGLETEDLWEGLAGLIHPTAPLVVLING